MFGLNVLLKRCCVIVVNFINTITYNIVTLESGMIKNEYHKLVFTKFYKLKINY